MKEVEIKDEIELTIRFGDDVKRFIEPMSFREFLEYTSKYRFIRLCSLNYAVNVNNIEKVKIILAD